jgi:hypothetical protein
MHFMCIRSYLRNSFNPKIIGFRFRVLGSEVVRPRYCLRANTLPGLAAPTRWV